MRDGERGFSTAGGGAALGFFSFFFVLAPSGIFAFLGLSEAAIELSSPFLGGSPETGLCGALMTEVAGSAFSSVALPAFLASFFALRPPLPSFGALTALEPPAAAAAASFSFFLRSFSAVSYTHLTLPTKRIV